MGVVFNIQRFSVHDGRGIRTVVFLKGCPLHCRWCANPESQAAKPELAFSQEKCLGLQACGICRQLCPQSRSETGKPILAGFQHADLKLQEKLASDCPAQALHLYGRNMEIAEVLEQVQQDEAFYFRSGGGMTLSGGEPFYQPEFAVGLLREARKRHIHTAVETCGCTSWEILQEAAPLLNQVMFDIKLLDEDSFQYWCGRAGQQGMAGHILANLEHLATDFPRLPILVRTPVIPKVNDDPDIIRAIHQAVCHYPQVKYELLPYHEYGRSKYEALGRDYPMGRVKLSDGKMKSLNNGVMTSAV